MPPRRLTSLSTSEYASHDIPNTVPRLDGFGRKISKNVFLSKQNRTQQQTECPQSPNHPESSSRLSSSIPYLNTAVSPGWIVILSWIGFTSSMITGLIMSLENNISVKSKMNQNVLYIFVWKISRFPGVRCGGLDRNNDHCCHIGGQQYLVHLMMFSCG